MKCGTIQIYLSSHRKISLFNTITIVLAWAEDLVLYCENIGQKAQSPTNVQKTLKWDQIEMRRFSGRNEALFYEKRGAFLVEMRRFSKRGV
jgi:hypothetical protein